MTRLTPDERSASILSAAVTIANEDGLTNVTPAMVTERSGIARRTVGHYFTMRDLRRAVAEDSRANKDVRDEAVALGLVT